VDATPGGLVHQDAAGDLGDAPGVDEGDPPSPDGARTTPASPIQHVGAEQVLHEVVWTKDGRDCGAGTKA